MEIRFSLLSNYRTYGIELRERNYPTFEGKYNAYISCYGQLSGDYLGAIPSAIANDINENDAVNLPELAESFIMSHFCNPVIW